MGNREHRYVDRQLSAYVDGELGRRGRARVEAHLANCQACRANLRSLRWTKELLQASPAVKVPRSFVVREADVARPVRVRGFGPLPAMQWATAVVALLLILVLGGDLLLGPRVPGAFDALRPMGGENALASPATLESDRVAMAERAAPPEGAVEMAEEAAGTDAIEAPVQEQLAPKTMSGAATKEPAVEMAVPEGETGGAAPPPQVPGARGEITAPVTTTPGEPMMALVVPEEAITTTQAGEDATAADMPPAPEVTPPAALTPESTPLPEAAPPLLGTTVPDEGERVAELLVTEPTDALAVPTPEQRDATWAETVVRDPVWRAVGLGVEVLLAAVLIGLVTAVLWVRLRR